MSTMNKSVLIPDLKRIFRLLWLSGKKTAFINVIIRLLLSVLPIASLYCIKLLIEQLVNEHSHWNHILEVIILFGLVQLLLALVGQYGSYIDDIYQQKLTDYLSTEVLEKATTVDYEYYENPAYHNSLHLAQQRSIYKGPQILDNFNALLLNSLSLIFLIAFFISLNSLFGLLFMVLSIPLACIKWYSGFMLLRMERQFTPLERESNYLYQVMTGVSFAKEVRVFGFGVSFISKFQKIRTYIYDEKKKLELKLTLYSLIAEAIEIIAMVVIFGLLAKSTWEKSISIGLFVIYVQGFQRLQSTSRGFLMALVQAFQLRLFLKDLFTFLDLPTKESIVAETPFPDLKEGLVLKNLSFAYPQTDKTILRNISMHCRPGEIIALVGENGSGKSTLVKLLARLYDLQSGAITVDQIPISSINTPSFREKSIFLFQDFEKYFFSIADNITLGNETSEKSIEKVIAAAKLSGADAFITKLTKGYQTRMGRVFEGSEQLSGGQWQKLALSRVFYQDAQLIILDEPTSALDPQAEFELFNNIKTLAKNKMVILVSHRLYNLKMVDRIYVMHEGCMVEEGSFQELTQQNGLFKKLYDLQKL